MDKPTREQLRAQVSALQSELASVKEQKTAQYAKHQEHDLDVRTQLSVALGAGTYSKFHYSDDLVQIVYDWDAIFRKVGKLLERKKHVQ